MAEINEVKSKEVEKVNEKEKSPKTTKTVKKPKAEIKVAKETKVDKTAVSEAPVKKKKTASIVETPQVDEPTSSTATVPHAKRAIDAKDESVTLDELKRSIASDVKGEIDKSNSDKVNYEINVMLVGASIVIAILAVVAQFSLSAIVFSIIGLGIANNVNIASKREVEITSAILIVISLLQMVQYLR